MATGRPKRILILAAKRIFTTGNMVLAGILITLLGDLMFALNDTMGKWLVASFSVGQVLLIRSMGAFVILAPMLARQGLDRLVRVDRPGLQVARVILSTLDTGLFYAAVVYMPLADVIAFYMAAPIYVAVASHFFLGEKVGWRRWLAILVGFAGVLVALSPSPDSLSMASLFAVAGSLSFGLLLVLNRVLRGTSDTTLVTWQTAGALVVGGAMVLTGGWIAPTAFDLGAMLLLGIVSCAAHLLITRGLKLAPASTLAPLQYSLLLWGVVFGYMFFGDVPEVHIWIGSGIIVLAGIFIFHRQSVKAEVPPESVPRGVN
jgi:S-adenosylmethionine uptake transporter